MACGICILCNIPTAFAYTTVMNEQKLVVPADTTQVCRICLDKDDRTNLISPCHCKGSIKYVHADCIASWRISLAHRGRQRGIYHCSLCGERFLVRYHRRWTKLMKIKAVRIILVAILLVLVLIPSGTVMKILIHLSMQLANYTGGLNQVWASGSLPSLIMYAMQNSLRHTFSYGQQVKLGTREVLYAPFPVCFRNALSQGDHSLVGSQLLYYFMFPFTDDRVWHFILCRLEHFHLGFFLLGSFSNIWFTYKILSDMFDIILAAQGDGPQTTYAHRVGKVIKGFLLTYCCVLVVLFWIHFNLFAFHVDTRGEVEGYTSRQFITELPLWAFRWVTLGIAVGDFVMRGIYSWLDRITNNVEDEQVVSLPQDTAICS